MASRLNTGLEPRKNELQSVPLFDFLYKFVNGEIASNRGEQSLDCRFVAIYVEESTDYLRRPDRVDSLNVDLNELCETVLIQVKHKIVYEVKTVANDDEG